MNPPDPPLPGYDTPNLARLVEALTPAQIDELPFGVMRIGRDGRVAAYNRTEAVQSGFGDRPRLGLEFFTSIAPCMDTPFVRGRIDQALAAGTLDLRLRHVGDFADRDRVLDLRAQSASGGGFWLFVRRADA